MTDTARLYGGSLYDLAAGEELSEEIGSQLEQIRTLFKENPDYIRLLNEPSIPLKKRQELIEEAFGAQAQRYLVSFLKLLCERGLLRDFGGCCEAFNTRFYADHGIAKAVATSAVGLTADQQEALRRKLEKISGKQVVLEVRKDPSVIAGLRVEMEGKLLDGTVHGRVQDLSRRLKEA